MGNAGSRGPKITQQDRAVLEYVEPAKTESTNRASLKLQRDRVRQYQTKLQYVLDREYAIAREALRAGDKNRARLALRRRAYQQGLIRKTDEQIATLQELVTTIEFAQLEQSIMYGLEQGNEVLKQIHKETSIERVEELMQNTSEAQEYQREVDERLVSQLSAAEQEAVDEELAALAAEQQPAPPTETAPPLPPMPGVPSGAPVPHESPVRQPQRLPSTAEPTRAKVPVMESS